MASELSNYLAGAILGWIAGTEMPAEGDVYVALYNGDPTATGTGGTEVTEDIRPSGRMAVSFGAVASRQITNDADLDFGMSAGEVTVTHAALFDAASGGNMLMYTPLDNTRNVEQGDPVVIPSGDLRANFN